MRRRAFPLRLSRVVPQHGRIMPFDENIGTILLVDDQAEVLDLFIEDLESTGARVETATCAEDALERLRAGSDDIQAIILDLDFGPGRMDGMTALDRIRGLNEAPPVIMLTGHGAVRVAVDALRKGAVDFVEKDQHMSERLRVAIERVRRESALTGENRQLRRDRDRFKKDADRLRDEQHERYLMVGDSPAMTDLRERLTRAAVVPRPVLIRGERGSGKELAAAALHYLSPRADGPFVKVNCAAFAGELMESELFGHEAGAFTGATGQKIGRFEMADGGTLFLDEIANATLEFQKTILRVIEYQEFERVQGTETIRVDTRVIAATNADLTAEIANGTFRGDLYDRLTFQEITVPPVRKRLSDIDDLAEHFIARFADEAPSLDAKPLSEDALKKLLDYNWPGNVRELKNVIESALCMARGDEIEADDIRFLSQPSDLPNGVDASLEGGDFKTTIRNTEIAILQRALEEAGGNQSAAARELGLTYDQFRTLYRKYNL